MYKLCMVLLVFVGLALVFSSGVLGYEDYIGVYRDPGFTKEATAFDDGDTVYIKVTDLNTQSVPASATVTNVEIGNSITVPLSNSAGSKIYLGQFTVSSESNDDVNDKLLLLDGQEFDGQTFNRQTAIITADLAKDGNAASAEITALYTPPPPTNLKATAIAGGKVKLEWNAPDPQDTVKEYNIYRDTAPGKEDYLVTTVSATDSSSYEYTDSSLEIEKVYYYIVKAVDRTGDESDPSNEVSVKVGKDMLLYKFESKVVRQGSPLEIVLSVKESVNVNIKILNLNGEIVKEDVIFPPPQVETSWTWNGENMHGQKVNNGVYILLIEVGEGGQIEKKIVGVLF